MKITVVATGSMGAGFVRQLQAAGHQVRVTGRNADKAATLAAQFPGAGLGTAIAPAWVGIN